jgi:hypothetical protein
VLLLIDLLLDLRSWLPKRSSNWRVESKRVVRTSQARRSLRSTVGPSATGWVKSCLWCELYPDDDSDFQPPFSFRPPFSFPSDSEARDWVDRHFALGQQSEGMRVYRPGERRPFYLRELSEEEGRKKFWQSEHRSRDQSLCYPEDWAELKHQVLVRDGYHCANCGGSGEMHVHHIVPLSKGGTNNLTNLKALCRNCHVLVHPHMKDQVRDFD